MQAVSGGLGFRGLGFISLIGVFLCAGGGGGSGRGEGFLGPVKCGWGVVVVLCFLSVGCFEGGLGRSP